MKNILAALLILSPFASGFSQILPYSKYNIVVIAHRGDHTAVPENTVAAIKNAIKAGADYVEIDVRETSDGVQVLMHDASLRKMTGSPLNVRDIDFLDIRKLKVTSTVSGKKEYNIPTLKEAFKATGNKINIYLDFKEGNVEQTFELIKKMKMEKRIVVYVNALDDYKKWKTFAPKIPIIASLPKSVVDSATLDAFMQVVELNVADNVIADGLLKACKAKNISIWLDAQGRDEGPDKWNTLLGAGIDGIQTDNPKALIDYLIKTKRRFRLKPLELN